MNCYGAVAKLHIERGLVPQSTGYLKKSVFFHIHWITLLQLVPVIASHFTTRTQTQYKDGLFRYGISIIKIRRSWDSLSFIRGITMLVRRHLYIGTAPSVLILVKQGLKYRISVKYTTSQCSAMIHVEISFNQIAFQMYLFLVEEKHFKMMLANSWPFWYDLDVISLC